MREAHTYIKNTKKTLKTENIGGWCLLSFGGLYPIYREGGVKIGLSLPYWPMLLRGTSESRLQKEICKIIV